MSNDINEWKGYCYELEAKVKHLENVVKNQNKTIEYQRVQNDVLTQKIIDGQGLEIPSIVLKNATLIEDK